MSSRRLDAVTVSAHGAASVPSNPPAWGQNHVYTNTPYVTTTTHHSRPSPICQAAAPKSVKTSTPRVRLQPTALPPPQAAFPLPSIPYTRVTPDARRFRLITFHPRAGLGLQRQTARGVPVSGYLPACPHARVVCGFVDVHVGGYVM